MPLHLLGISRSGDIAGLSVPWSYGQAAVSRHRRRIRTPGRVVRKSIGWSTDP